MKKQPALARNHASCKGRRGAFTLAEMLVAVGIFLVMLVVMLVPLRLAVDSMTFGRGQSTVQQEAKLTVSQIRADLGKAIHVYPNARLKGVATTGPYFVSTDFAVPTSVQSDCTASTSYVAWDNPSRVDFLLPQVSSTGTSNVAPSNPIQAAGYLVTYYARRLDPTKNYDALDNPVVLFRAQVPYIAAHLVSGLRVACPLDSNWDTEYLGHNFWGEANLQPLCVDYGAAPVVPGAHTLAIPRGMALNVSGDTASTTFKAALQPDTTFTCSDVNGDGVIDKVTINLGLVNYSLSPSGSSNGKASSQVARDVESVDVPNAR